MDKIAGIITYHAAYNFGSVLQALATQTAIEKIGVKAQIINYRPVAQLKYYHNVYRTHSGAKSLLIDLLNTPNIFRKRIRAQRFEKFIANNLKMTSQMYTKPGELEALHDVYDVTVSGSDQILNKHSNELENEEWSMMSPYLLAFTKGRKVSYASSPASMTDQELKKIQPALSRFDALSARELDSAKRLSKLLGKAVPNVLDPTLLLSAQDWSDVATQSPDSHIPASYILYYTLLGPKQVLSQKKELEKLAKRMGMPVVLICPYSFIPESKIIINGLAAGPAEFLSLVLHASLVVTDSYHGTLFSMNFGTPFWSISNGKGSHTRKDQILARVGLEDRVVDSIATINAKSDVLPGKPTDIVLRELQSAREESYAYLRMALLD